MEAPFYLFIYLKNEVQVNLIPITASCIFQILEYISNNINDQLSV